MIFTFRNSYACQKLPSQNRSIHSYYWPCRFLVIEGLIFGFSRTREFFIYTNTLISHFIWFNNRLCKELKEQYQDPFPLSKVQHQATHPGKQKRQGMTESDEITQLQCFGHTARLQRPFGDTQMDTSQRMEHRLPTGLALDVSSNPGHVCNAPLGIHINSLLTLC